MAGVLKMAAVMVTVSSVVATNHALVFFAAPTLPDGELMPLQLHRFLSLVVSFFFVFCIPWNESSGGSEVPLEIWAFGVK